MEIEVYVEILNLRYVVKGFTAIKELKEWLDEHASDTTIPAVYPEEVPEPETSPAPEYSLQAGNGGIG